jgi:hypothetical protein
LKGVQKPSLHSLFVEFQRSKLELKLEQQTSNSQNKISFFKAISIPFWSDLNKATTQICVVVVMEDFNPILV